MKKSFIFTLLLSLQILTLSSAANALETPYQAVFSKWLVDNSVKNAALVVTKNGQQIYAQGHGGFKPTQGFFLASLSKAITGACVAKLVQTGKVTFEKPLSQAMPKFIAAHGIKNASLEKTTVGDVIRHKTGISRASGNFPLTDAPAAVAALTVVSGASAHSYSNGNYFILGELIKEITGQNHYSYCQGATGIAGRPDPEWGLLGAAGGWNVTPQSYLAFYEGMSSEKFKYGARAHKFSFGEGQGYGLGTYSKVDGINHWGAWQRPGFSHGTMARRFPNGNAYFIAHQPQLTEGMRRDIEASLRKILQSR